MKAFIATLKTGSRNRTRAQSKTVLVLEVRFEYENENENTRKEALFARWMSGLLGGELQFAEWSSIGCGVGSVGVENLIVADEEGAAEL